MGLKEQLSSDMKAAMKAKDRQKTSVLRMLLSEVKYAQAAQKAGVELADQDVLKVISSYHKRLVKSLEDYPHGEQRDEIKLEAELVAQYLPKKATRVQVEAKVDELLKTNKNQPFGSLMKALMAELGDAADGKLISEVLKQKRQTED